MKEKNEVGELKLPELRFSAELQNQSTSVVLLPYPDGIIQNPEVDTNIFGQMVDTDADKGELSFQQLLLAKLDTYMQSEPHI